MWQLRIKKLQRGMKKDLLKKREKNQVLMKRVLVKRRKQVMKRKSLLLTVMMNDVSCSPLATFVLKRGSSSRSGKFVCFCLIVFVCCHVL